MPLKATLQNLISTVRLKVQTATLDAAAVKEATDELANHNYQYDVSLFPALPQKTWPIPAGAAPESLAEALLWKMGKWKVYRSFVAHYADTASLAENGVVFYAFAKHLANPNNPIYDQHTLRALWAIDALLTRDQTAICRRLLATVEGCWKPILSGANSIDGYVLYAERIALLVQGGATMAKLDKLLMPLGQALKDNTADVAEFESIAGCAQ